jgi:tetratricopeptide (TPR) repeat protein
VAALIESGDREDEIGALLDELDQGDAHDRALATVLRVRNYPAGDLEDLLGQLDAAEAILVGAGDTIGLGRCEIARAWVYWGACRMGDGHRAYRRADDLLRSAGSGILHHEVIFGIGLTAVFSDMAADDFLELLDELDGQAANAGPMLAATLRSFRARTEYGSGKGTLEALHAATSAEVEMLEQTGNAASAIAPRMYELVVVPWLEADAVAVEAGARERAEITRRVGRRLYHANSLAFWAIALCEIGDAERASATIAEARLLADPDDVADQIDLDLAEGYARALLGEPEIARQLLDRALARREGTDMNPPAISSQYVEARVRLALGDVDRARSLFEKLARDQEQRGFHLFAERYRRELAALDGSSSHSPNRD